MPRAFQIVTLCSSLVSLVGCYAPDVAPCQVSCAEAGGECPEGTSCSGGYCNPPGVEAATCRGGDMPEGMVLIPDTGSFLMGCDAPNAMCDPDEDPAHLVRLSPYLIDITEVTAADYAECVTAAACSEPTAEDTAYYDPVEHGGWPVTGMNRSTAAAYCTWRDKRLPTEAEWEKAAGGGVPNNAFPWGPEAPGCYEYAQYYLADGTCPWRNDPVNVASFPRGASEYGVMDMSGNVWEWVSDWSGAYSAEEITDPQGPAEPPEGTANTGMVRGGGFMTSDLGALLVSNRYPRPHTLRTSTFGMRCAKDAP